MQKSRSLVPDGMVAANAAVGGGGGGGPTRPAAGATAPPADARLVIGGRVVEIVMQLAPNDILLGRGAPIANYEGNIRFRRLVHTRKDAYMAASRHLLKQTIATEVYNEILSQRRGRFLAKLESSDVRYAEAAGIVMPRKGHVWYIADEKVAMEKVKQALRDKEQFREPPTAGVIVDAFVGSVAGVASSCSIQPTLPEEPVDGEEAAIASATADGDGTNGAAGDDDGEDDRKIEGGATGSEQPNKKPRLAAPPGSAFAAPLSLVPQTSASSASAMSGGLAPMVSINDDSHSSGRSQDNAVVAAAAAASTDSLAQFLQQERQRHQQEQPMAALSSSTGVDSSNFASLMHRQQQSPNTLAILRQQHDRNRRQLQQLQEQAGLIRNMSAGSAAAAVGVTTGSGSTNSPPPDALALLLQQQERNRITQEQLLQGAQLGNASASLNAGMNPTELALLLQHEEQQRQQEQLSIRLNRQRLESQLLAQQGGALGSAAARDLARSDGEALTRLQLEYQQQQQHQQHRAMAIERLRQQQQQQQLLNQLQLQQQPQQQHQQRIPDLSLSTRLGLNPLTRDNLLALRAQDGMQSPNMGSVAAAAASSNNLATADPNNNESLLASLLRQQGLNVNFDGQVRRDETTGRHMESSLFPAARSGDAREEQKQHSGTNESTQASEEDERKPQGEPR